MYSRTFTSIGIALTLFLHATPARAASLERVVEKTQALDEGATCELESISGRVEVRPAKDRTCVFKAVVRARATSEAEARKALDRITIEVSATPRGLRARTVHDSVGDWAKLRSLFTSLGRTVDTDVSYSVDLPQKVALKVRTVSADISASGVDGDVDARTVSGEVEVERVGGRVSLESISGEIEASAPGGPWSISSVSGDVDIDLGARAQGAVPGGSAGTVSGDITLRVPEGARLEVSTQTVSGEVANDLKEGSPTKAQLKTVSGDIEASRAPTARKAPAGEKDHEE